MKCLSRTEKLIFVAGDDDVTTFVLLNQENANYLRDSSIIYVDCILFSPKKGKTRGYGVILQKNVCILYIRSFYP